MNIVVPVSLSDIHRLGNHLEVLLKFGGLENHFLTYLPTPSVQKEVEERVQVMKSICPNVSVVALPQDPAGEWPIACNYHFYCGAVSAEKVRLPWLWLELDALPRKPQWADRLAMAYGSLNSPFAGHVVPYEQRDKDTGRLSSPFGPNDKFMCGVGMYPFDAFAKGQPLIGDFSKGPSSAKEAFDQYLRPMWKKFGVQHTNLIDDQWNTSNYRMENGDLVCDCNDLKPGWPTRRGKVNLESVLVHGCKDDSLFSIIMGRDATPKNEETVYPVAVEQLVPTPEEPKSYIGPSYPQYVTKDELQKFGDGLVERLLKGLQPTSVTSEPIKESPPVEPKSQLALIEEAKAKLAIKNYTLSKLSEEMSMKKELLKKVLEANGYHLNGPAQWIKVSELQPA